MSVDLTKGATVELVKTLSDDLRTRDDNTKYSSAGAAMRDKANVDGYYEGLTSGTTEQIASSIYEEDNTPYTFRTAGGSIDIGDREEDTIVGGTVAWNQLVSFTENVSTEKDVVWKRHTDGSIEFNGTASSSGGIAGFPVANGQNHIYYIAGNPQNDPNGMYLSSQSYGVDLRNKGTLIKNLSANKTWYYTFAVTSGVTYDNVVFKPQCFDLTQMFGSTIADYIYSLEQATAGEGVAWFKKLFPKPYYAYNAGSLKSVEGLSAHKMRGFNAWDEEWEVGTINATTGANNSDPEVIRSKNYIPVVPNTQYYVHIGSITGLTLNIRSRFYDADKNYIGTGGTVYFNAVFTTPSNARYMRFALQSAYGTTYKNDICINLHWDGERDGEYEPYEEHVYDLDLSLTLRGIPKLDGNNNLYYDGDVYKADGTVERKYGIVDLGTLTWGVSSTGTSGKSRFVTHDLSVKGIPNAQVCNAVSSKYIATTANKTYLLNDGVCFNNNDNSVIIYDNAYAESTVAQFTTAMSGVYLVYELATPTTETAQPYAQNQTVNDFGTEEYVSETNMIPVGHETKYQANLKAKLEMAPDSPADNGDYVVRHTDGQNAYVSLAPILAEKANASGTYDDIVSGGTKQIISSIYEEDSEPYLFRTSGGSIDIGDREEDTIVGGTVAWNQLCPNPTTAEIAKAFPSGTQFIAGHKYLYDFKGTLIDPSGTAPYVYLYLRQTSESTETRLLFKTFGSVIDSPRTSLTANGRSNADGGAWLYFSSTANLNLESINAFDLTQMFGSTIADYIYSLEQANAGAGVAWFKKLFPKPYYAYNAGELLSVSGLQSHDTVGFNACGSALEFGNIDSTGQNAGTYNTYIRTADYIRVVPNNAYCFYASTSQQFMQLYILQYDADKNVISRDALIAGSSLGTTKKIVYTISANTNYVRMFIYKNSQFTTVDGVNFCINLSWDGERDGEYEPYVKHSYPLDDSLTLRGIPKLDANNNLYYDGDVYEADGTVTRNWAVSVFDGSADENWIAYPSFEGFYITNGFPNMGSRIRADAVCNLLTCSKSTASGQKNAFWLGVNTEYFYVLGVYESMGNTVEAFRTYLSTHNLVVVYPLATPTTEEAEPYQTPQIVDDFGTEEYVTDSIVPVGHNTKYMPNLKAKLEMAPDSPSDNGDYIVRHTNGQNEYVPLVIPTELPTMPTDNGTYKLKVTVANGTATLSWESES